MACCSGEIEGNADMRLALNVGPDIARNIGAGRRGGDSCDIRGNYRCRSSDHQKARVCEYSVNFSRL
jgi:hypothetical protein